MSTQRRSISGLALRSILWAVLLPGVVAGYLPWRFFGLSTVHVEARPTDIAGLALIAAGTSLLTMCIWEFARTGKGTLSPVDPPRQLVAGGLYRYVRNPMYLSVSTILLGEAVVARSAALGLYWVAWFILMNLFVVGYEEPTLRRQFGPSYEEYARVVRRWVPTRRWSRNLRV